MNPRVEVGDTIRAAEPEYLYGTGPLVLRVTKVGQVQRLNDGDWLEVEGYELRGDGAPQVAGRPRHVFVRVAALLAQKRPRGKP
jgi:hypothetical protein